MKKSLSSLQNSLEHFHFISHTRTRITCIFITRNLMAAAAPTFLNFIFILTITKLQRRKFEKKITVRNKILYDNCTEWSAIWCEIKRVITEMHDHEAGTSELS